MYRYLSVNSPELIFDLVNAKPGTNHSTNPTNPTYPTNPANPTTATTINSGELMDKNRTWHETEDKSVLKH